MSAPSQTADLQRVVYQARELGNVVGALELCANVWRRAAGDREGRYHLRALVPWVLELLGAEHDRAALQQRLGLPESLFETAGSLPVGAGPGAAPNCTPQALSVGLLLVDCVGSGEGLIAGLERVDGVAPSERLPPKIGAGCRVALERAERAVLRWLAERHGLEPTRLALDHGFRVFGPPAAEWSVDGQSVGLAAGLVVFAELTARDLPQGLLVTGALAEDGTVQPVGGVPAKLAAALRERPAAPLILVPQGQRPRGRSRGDASSIVAVADLAEAVEVLFGVDALAEPPSAGFNIEALLRRGVELYEKAARFAEAEIVLEAALSAIERRRVELGDPELFRGEELIARWRAASARVHIGDVVGALAGFESAGVLAETLWEAERIEPSVYLGLRGNWAVALRDAERLVEAEALLEGTLATQRALRVGKRELARTLGNLGELRTIAGHYEAAQGNLEASLAALRESYPDEVPRSLCYLGNLELARGAFAAALARYDDGLAENTRVQTGAASNELFLRYGRARALLAAQRVDACLAEVERAAALPGAEGLYPGALIQLVRGRALLRRELGAARSVLEAVRARGEQASGLLAFGLALTDAHLARYLIADDPAAHRGEIVALCSALDRASRAWTSRIGVGEPVALAPAARALPEGAAALAERLVAQTRRFPY